MAKQIKLRVILNKGRKGVPLEKLPKVLAELYSFLDDMAEDLGIQDGSGWQGIQFKNGSLDFLAVKNTPVDESQYARFNESARHVVANDDDQTISRRTRAQYARIASPLDPDEAVEIGIEKYERELEEGPLDSEDVGSFDWHQLDKLVASKIQEVNQAKVRAFASIQGKIHSVFIEAEQPHFTLRELASQNLINCFYTDDKYSGVARAIESKGAVVFVNGFSVTDMVSRKVERFDVTSITPAPKADADTLERFIGCAPGLKIDLLRRRGD